MRAGSASPARRRRGCSRRPRAEGEPQSGASLRSTAGHGGAAVDVEAVEAGEARASSAARSGATNRVRASGSAPACCPRLGELLRHRRALDPRASARGAVACPLALARVVVGRVPRAEVDHGDLVEPEPPSGGERRGRVHRARAAAADGERHADGILISSPAAKRCRAGRDVALVGLHDHQHDHRVAAAASHGPARRRRRSAAHVLGVGGKRGRRRPRLQRCSEGGDRRRRAPRRARHAAEGGALGLLAGEPGARQRVAVAASSGGERDEGDRDRVRRPAAARCGASSSPGSCTM